MKKIIALGVFVGAFLVVGISSAQAQFVVGARVEVVPGAFNLNIRPTPSTTGTALGAVNPGARGTVTGGPVSGQGYSWSKVRWDSAPEGWSVNTPWLTVISLPQPSCGDINKDGVSNITDVTLVVDVAFRSASYPNYNTDVNGSGATDVIDVAEEVDYVLRGMAEPTGCLQGPASNLTLLVAPLGVSNGRVINAVDDIARLDFKAGSGGDIILNSLRLTFAGSALDNNSSFGSGVKIYEANSGSVYNGTSSASCNSTLCYVDFNFGKEPSGGFAIWAGGTLSLVVRVDGTKFGPARPGVSLGLITFFEEFSDIKYLDVRSGIGNLTLPLSSFPISVNNVSYAVGTGGNPSNQPPVISLFSGPATLNQGTQGTWQVTANDPEGGNLTYQLLWGDGTSSSSSVQLSGQWTYYVHAYSQSGRYYPAFRVADNAGLVANSTTTVLVPTSTPNQPPTNLSIDGPSVLTTSTVGVWGFIATDPAGGNLTYNVNWGDGSASSTASGVSSGNTRVFSHTYLGNGTYTIAFTATNQGGLSTSLTKLVTVNVGAANQPPVVNYFSGPAGLNVNQSGAWWAGATDPDPGSSTLSYVFGWGDGSPSSTALAVEGNYVSASHSYVANGIYWIGLIVSDPQGASGFRGASVTVTSSSTAPVAPSPKTSPYNLSPSASVIDSLQAQLLQISQQLNALLLQLGR